MRLRLSLVVVGLALAGFALPNPASAAVETLGTYDTPGQAYGVAISGTYAYVVDIGVGLHVVDISNPAAPTLAATYANTSANRLALYGNRVYVTGTNTLEIIDITTPTNPVLLGSYTNSNFYMGQIATDGSTAYILGYVMGTVNPTQFQLAAVDVRTPASPTLLNMVNTNGGADVTVANGFIYTVHDHTFTIWNSSLVTVGSFTDPSTSTVSPYYLGVAVSGTTAVVNDTTFGFHVFDITNPAAPTRSSNVSLGFGQTVVLSGTTAYAGGLGGISVINVATPSAPTLLGKSGGTLNVIDVTVSGSIAAVAALETGVRFYNVAQPDSTGPVFSFDSGTGTSHTLKPGAAFSDKASVTDNLDGAMTTYTKTGTVNRNRVGKYTLTYKATDSLGNITTTVRTIFVLPTAEQLKLTKGAYTLTVGKKRVTLRPFPGYSGNITARKLVVRTKADPYYMFISTSATKAPAIVLYDATGKLVKRQSLATVSTGGLNLQLAVNPATSTVLISVSPKKSSLTATLYSIGKNGLGSLGKVKATTGTGTLIQKFLQVYANEYALVTKVSGNEATEPKIWRYSPSKKVFAQEKSLPVSLVLTWTKTDVKLRSVVGGPLGT